MIMALLSKFYFGIFEQSHEKNTVLEVSETNPAVQRQKMDLERRAIVLSMKLKQRR